jgi:hypothetical protein
MTNPFATLRENFQKDGFIHTQIPAHRDVCIQLEEEITHRLNALPTKHGCSRVDYLSTVNRWPLAALVNKQWQTTIITLLQPQINALFGQSLDPYEVDVLYKSPFARRPTPWHQDVAYAFKKPYFASTWLSLTDNPVDASPLQFLPRSHLQPIEPAVDFWQPDFVDKLRQSPECQQQAKTVPTQRGDTVIFSSAIWHASLEHQADQVRLAIVIRWGDEALNHKDIPLPLSVPFGLWNCGQYTYALLQQGLKVIAGQVEQDMLAIVAAWKKLIVNKAVPFLYPYAESLTALERLRVLHEAHVAYQGGDSQGIVYAELWRHFLKNLADYLQVIK